MRFFYKIIAADLYSEAQSMLRKYFNGLDLPAPRIRIVDRLTGGFLGRCRYKVGDATTTIEIQKSILNHERTRKRTLAHELVHHADFILNLSKLDGYNLKAYRKYKDDAHGNFFKDYSKKINQIENDPTFVNETSDESDVIEATKEYYILIAPSKMGRGLGWSWAARISTQQKKFIEYYTTNNQAKLLKTKDRRWLGGEKIGKSFSIPIDKERQDELKKMYGQ